jgi:hypothetical protein
VAPFDGLGDLVGLRVRGLLDPEMKRT